MTILRVESDANPGSNQIESAWHRFFLERMDHFSTLVRCLLADETLVNSVISRAVSRLASTPIYGPDVFLNYKRARGALIAEAIASLNSQQNSASPRHVRLGR